jgi:hypothetical protein
MRTRFALMVFVLIASHALAQPAPGRRQTPQAPQPPPAPVQPAAPASSTPPPPPPPAPPGPPRREGQPINVKVELTITEEGGGATSSKKTVSAVIGDGFNGYVRANGNNLDPNAAPSERFVPLNFDAYPVILSNGKIRLTCSIQYLAGAAQYTAVAASPPGGASQNQRARTDIKENIVLILESGKSLVVSQAADPVSDRQVTVEVRATILR